VGRLLPRLLSFSLGLTPALRWPKVIRSKDPFYDDEHTLTAIGAGDIPGLQ
jgi:hypothetical protein